MKTLAGVLCCVTFLASALATVASSKIDYTIFEREDNQGVTDHSGTTEPDQAEVKGCRLEVVTSRGCYPCKRFKETTLPELIEAGYEVKVVDHKDDTRDTKQVPTLYYIGRLAQVTRSEVGYKTFKHVIKYLEKP